MNPLKLGEVVFEPSQLHHLTAEYGFAYIFSTAQPHDYPKGKSKVVYVGMADKLRGKRVFDSLGQRFKRVANGKSRLTSWPDRLLIHVVPADAPAEPAFLEAALLRAFKDAFGDLPLANDQPVPWDTSYQEAMERRPDVTWERLVEFLKSIG